MRSDSFALSSAIPFHLLFPFISELKMNNKGNSSIAKGTNFFGQFIAFVFVMINFIVDILYYFIDPRIRVKGDVSSG